MRKGVGVWSSVVRDKVDGDGSEASASGHASHLSQPTRAASDTTPRARVTNLVVALAHGAAVELLRPELQRHALGIWLTSQETDWFWHDAPIVPSETAERHATAALAWVLCIADALDLDAGAYPAMQDVLDDSARQADTFTLRAEADVHDTCAQRERAAADPAGDCAGRALRWVLDERSEWSR